MANLNKFTVSGILSAIAISFGSLGTTATLFDNVHQSEEEIKQLSNQLELLDEQLEDLKHENIITRVHNAKEILEFCDMSIDEKNNLLSFLSNSIKEATLRQNYELAEINLKKVIPFLMECEVYPKFK